MISLLALHSAATSVCLASLGVGTGYLFLVILSPRDGDRIRAYYPYLVKANILTGVAAIAVFLTGMPWRYVAAVLALKALLLVLSRFYRKKHLLNRTVLGGWVLAAAAVFMDLLVQGYFG